MKTIWAGAGLAVMAGMLMGAAMRPDLAGDDRAAGPQIVQGPPARATGPFADDGPTLVAYSGKTPDYVTGSDWSRPARMAATAAPAGGQAAAQSESQETDYYERPQLDLPPTPAEPTESEVKARDLTPAAYDAAAVVTERGQIEADAPPEATGDTTPAN